MFGCQAIYVQNKIVLILRNRSDHRVDNGVWIATDYQHHRSLRNEFPTMRAIELFGKNGSAWQNLPSNAIDFEEAVISACRLIMKGDLRIGKTPKAKKRKGNT